ncbi:MAG TPA: hypothetical protein VH478_15655 [Trebonia sp.]|nr:hypothetical protein [Trebonia sp.]
MPAAADPGAASDVVGGRYALTAPASRDGARERWHGHDQLLHREVTLTKVPLPPSPGERDAQVSAVLREARADLTVLDVVDTPATLWIVTSPAAPRPPGVAARDRERIAGQPGVPGPASPDRVAPRLTIGGLPVPLPAAGNPGGGRLGAIARSSPGLAVGVATGVIMIAALILVTLLFPSHHHPVQPPGRPGTSPAATATPLLPFPPGSG